MSLLYPNKQNLRRTHDEVKQRFLFRVYLERSFFDVRVAVGICGKELR